MADLMQGAMQWLSEQRKKFTSGSVTYRQDDYTVENVPATIGRTIFKTFKNYGAALRTVSRDFLIDAADLGFDGDDKEPERGDAIIQDGYRYEVKAPSDEPVWRWTDGYKRTMRIHTNFIGKEDS